MSQNAPSLLSRRRRRSLPLRIALGAALCGLALSIGTTAVVPARATQSAGTVEIDTASGPHTFDVEVMRSEDERAHGLMDRKSMPKSHGMLFDFQTEQPEVMFWMKDTFIPLDMIFVAQDGRVVGIKHDAKPMDEKLIHSGAPTLGVIELNAGTAKAIGLAIGDHVKNPIFHPADQNP